MVKFPKKMTETITSKNPETNCRMWYAKGFLYILGEYYKSLEMS